MTSQLIATNRSLTVLLFIADLPAMLAFSFGLRASSLCAARFQPSLKKQILSLVA